MKNSITAIVFSLAIIGSSFVLGNAFMNRNKIDGTISVTGLGKTDFVSDLIVWEGRFEKQNFNLKQAYNDLENDKKIVAEYLTGKGIQPENVVFTAVQTRKNIKTIYSTEGRYMGEEFLGFILEQSIQIDSKDVVKVEKISRQITELLHKGVEFYSEAPRYYYTQLEDLKIEMVSTATENARLRAEKIAENSGSKLGELQDAKMGIFQITGEHSNEDYSWGGAYNTSSKQKTASITMKLTYNVK